MLIPVVILAMVGSLLLLERRANSAETQSALLVDAELRVNHLHATLLEQLARGTLPDESVVDAEVMAQESAASATIDSLGPGPAMRHFAEYLRVASRVLELRQTARYDAAIDVGAVQLVPAFDAVQQDLNATRASLRGRAEAAELWREVGSILTLVLGGLLLMLMFRRAEGARRRLTASEAHETALQESDRRFESLMSESSDLVTVLDREGRVRFQSSSIEQMLGWKVEDVVGHDIREFLDEGHAANIHVVLKQAELRPDSRRAVDFQMRRSDGDMLSVEAVVIGRFDDPDIAVAS